MNAILGTCACLLVVFVLGAQPGDTLILKGQLIAWANVNPAADLPVSLGLRYLPQLNASLTTSKGRLWDVEASANLLGYALAKPFSAASATGSIRPYRLWARYSSKQWEWRLGLQKINFGSASLLRPLMWFDQVDPRDPIQFTDGVWGVLSRYYFLNNANVWLWGLYGNSQRRGWDLASPYKTTPEWGGRVQHPLPKGEAGISIHHRQADTRGLGGLTPAYARVPETRLGFDVKFDMAVGCWIEASWTGYGRYMGALQYQQLWNAGLDYTFGIGNGLYVACEQLLAAHGEQAFSLAQARALSLFNLTYPLGLFDQLGAIVYVDWTNRALYRFVHWRRQYDKSSLFVMAYWNPQQARLPGQSSVQHLYAGWGVQALFLFNH